MDAKMIKVSDTKNMAELFGHLQISFLANITALNDIGVSNENLMALIIETEQMKSTMMSLITVAIKYHEPNSEFPEFYHKLRGQIDKLKDDFIVTIEALKDRRYDENKTH